MCVCGRSLHANSVVESRNLRQFVSSRENLQQGNNIFNTRQVHALLKETAEVGTTRFFGCSSYHFQSSICRCRHWPLSMWVISQTAGIVMMRTCDTSTLLVSIAACPVHSHSYCACLCTKHRLGEPGELYIIGVVAYINNSNWPAC